MRVDGVELFLRKLASMFGLNVVESKGSLAVEYVSGKIILSDGKVTIVTPAGSVYVESVDACYIYDTHGTIVSKSARIRIVPDKRGKNLRVFVRIT